MITRSISPTQPPRWVSLLAEGVRNGAELLALLALDPATAPWSLDLHSPFPLRVPRGFVARMRRGDWYDPLLRQVLPLAVEETPKPGFLLDPVGDEPSRRPGGILHKYHGRALMILTGIQAFLDSKGDARVIEHAWRPTIVARELEKSGPDAWIRAATIAGEAMANDDKETADLYERVALMLKPEDVKTDVDKPV